LIAVVSSEYSTPFSAIFATRMRASAGKRTMATAPPMETTGRIRRAEPTPRYFSTRETTKNWPITAIRFTHQK
jgi:hypothetical protein